MDGNPKKASCAFFVPKPPALQMSELGDTVLTGAIEDPGGVL
jgi:hypothetical protein